MKLSQNDKLLNHLLSVGHISQREAYLDYNIQSLPRRIADLREVGYYIKTKRLKHPVSGQRYARYYLQF